THNFIIPHLGEIPLDKLSPIQIQKFYNKLLDMDKMHGEGKISTTTVRKVHKVLRAALDWGIKMKMLHSNVAKRVDPPKEKRTSVIVWTQEEASAFLEVSKGYRFYPLFYVALSTGMRIGELLSLKWEDIDWDREVIRVKRTLGKTSAGYILK